MHRKSAYIYKPYEMCKDCGLFPVELDSSPQRRNPSILLCRDCVRIRQILEPRYKASKKEFIKSNPKLIGNFYNKCTKILAFASMRHKYNKAWRINEQK